jgi:hypothetical protein
MGVARPLAHPLAIGRPAVNVGTGAEALQSAAARGAVRYGTRSPEAARTNHLVPQL